MSARKPLGRTDQRTERPGIRACVTATPDDPDAAIDWLNNGAHSSSTPFDPVGAETPSGHSSARVRAAGRSAAGCTEATVHRADVALALGMHYR